MKQNAGSRQGFVYNHQVGLGSPSSLIGSTLQTSGSQNKVLGINITRKLAGSGKYLGPTLHTMNQKLWECGPGICVSVPPPNDSDTSAQV